MRFHDFLRATVLLTAGAATAMAAVTIAGAAGHADPVVVIISAGWWVIAAVIGIVVGRRPEASYQIGSLLANARPQTSLPELGPARTLINRLWPLLASTVVACALAFVLPQAPGAAAGCAILVALAWRRQASAVRAIEERDGVRFYVMRTSPLKPIRLARTPGFRSNLFELNGASRQAQPRV